MIHTMQIQKQLNKKNYDYLFNVLKLHKNRNIDNDNYTEYKTYDYSNLGLNEIILKKIEIKNYKYPLFYAEMIINPSKIINKDNNIEILKEEDIDKFIFEFDKILNSIDSSLVSCKTWSINRIDFTRNINLTQLAEEYKINNIVEKYIKLMQRSVIAPRCKVKYNSKSHRISQKKGSFTFGNKSVTFIAYNKEQERQDKNKYNEIEDSKNILRLEIQCKNMKVNSIKYKNKWDSKFLYYFLNKELSYKTLMKYYKSSVSISNYYSLDKARSIINDSKVIKHKDTKEELIRILELINKNRSVPGAREEYKNNKRFNYYLKKLELLNINAITIPRSWKLTYLPNAWHLEDL